jgi:hypothetical protein
MSIEIRDPGCSGRTIRALTEFLEDNSSDPRLALGHAGGASLK